MRPCWFPIPSSPCTLILDARNRAGIFEPVFETRIDPTDVNIIRQAVNPQDKVVKTLESGHPHDKVDFVFVAEGYAEIRMGQVSAGRSTIHRGDLPPRTPIVRTRTASTSRACSGLHLRVAWTNRPRASSRTPIVSAS